ncbi:nucleoside deaminase [Paraglaciecola sp. L3A3]|uniref:nucleoside deaminase n=1 Tax=Paraglaciecola sp. L3A3 TaxID=2686358 RepID=UPI00131B739B|nr:nucleoside deaminase [Paraglaciecola sp. L3A3]
MAEQKPLNSRRTLLRFAGFSLATASIAPLLFTKAKAESDNRPSPPGNDPTAEQMLKHLRQANKVAYETMQNGHHPFGAVLVAADNETVVMEQGNISSVAHAESTLAQRAAKKFSAEELWGMTLYSTAEPCVMCAGTQYWANIGRLVYGMSEHQLLQLTGNNSENPTLDIPSRYVFSKSQKAIRVWGPIDEVVEEIAALHLEFWK